MWLFPIWRVTTKLAGGQAQNHDKAQKGQRGVRDVSGLWRLRISAGQKNAVIALVGIGVIVIVAAKNVVGFDNLWGRGVIGRRARLRIWWGNPCRFDSYRPYFENLTG